MLTIPAPDGIEVALFESRFIDEVAALMARNHERLARHEVIHPYDPDSLARRVAANLRGFIEGRSIELVILRERAPVGMVSVRINAFMRTGELACWVDEHSEGRQVALRAGHAAITEAFDRGLHRVEMRVATSNERSVRAVGRLGGHYEGVLREAGASANSRVDLALYSVLAHEWPRTRDSLARSWATNGERES